MEAMPEAMPEAMSEGWESALAIVAHPDDLEYGTASAIARWTSQGKKITYVMVSSGEAGIDGMHPDEAGPLREREEQASAEVVGVDEVEFLRYKDGVIEYGLPLRMDLARVIRRHRPEVVITQGHGLTRRWPRRAGRHQGRGKPVDFHRASGRGP